MPSRGVSRFPSSVSPGAGVTPIPLPRVPLAWHGGRFSALIPGFPPGVAIEIRTDTDQAVKNLTPVGADWRGGRRYKSALSWGKWRASNFFREAAISRARTGFCGLGARRERPPAARISSIRDGANSLGRRRPVAGPEDAARPRDSARDGGEEPARATVRRDGRDG